MLLCSKIRAMIGAMTPYASMRRSSRSRTLRAMCLSGLVAVICSSSPSAMPLVAPLGLASPQRSKTKQGKKAQKQAAPKTAETPVGEVRILDDKEAKAIIARLRKHVLAKYALKQRLKRSKYEAPKDPKELSKRERKAIAPSGSLLTRLDEVEALRKVQHVSLVPFIQRVLFFDPSSAVRIKAVGALLAQPERQVRKVAEKLLDQKRLREQGAIAGPLIKLLTFYGAKKKLWKELQRNFLDFGTIARIEIIRSIAARRDFDALPLLLEHVDPPAPKDVHGVANPPASYWKKRWQSWQAFKPAIVDAFKALLGREFQASDRAKEWIEAQGGLEKLRKKLGR